MANVDSGRVAAWFAQQGYNVDPAVAEILAGTADPRTAVETTIDAVPAKKLRITPTDLPDPYKPGDAATPDHDSSGSQLLASESNEHVTPSSSQQVEAGDRQGGMDHGSPPDNLTIANDITGQSTGTGEYGDFVAVFRDRYDRLAKQVSGRVRHRTARSLSNARGGTEVGMIGLVNDIRSTRNGHQLIELEDRTGTYPALCMKDDEEVATNVNELLYDELIGVEGRLSDDGGIIFAESIVFPDVPRTHEPNTADRPVKAALISDVHVGSQEFLADAWAAFAEWLGTEEAAEVEYVLIGGDMVEGVGVYPGQDEDLAVVDIYDQYRAFGEVLEAIPDDRRVIMIPGNHDPVRRAEPQPGLPDDFQQCFDHPRLEVIGNPSLVTIENVEILMYHGTSLDEVIANIPLDSVSYEQPAAAMEQLLRKRHLGPPYGGGLRIAPEARDYLVIDTVPDVFHAGHVHTIGASRYRGVQIVNSGCWQAQTAFQRRNNLEPEPGHAPILDLQTLEITFRKFV